jgi:hypothetical protein
MLFVRLDRNGDDIITREEVVEVIRQQQSGKPPAPGETLKGLTNQFKTVFGGAKKADAKKSESADAEKKTDGAAAPSSATGK